jgi:hypothetical protein
MYAVVVAQQAAGGGSQSYAGLTIAEWIGLLFGTGVVVTLVTKAWDWWQSRPLFRYSSAPKVDQGGSFVASITQRRNTTGVVIAASVVAVVSRWYRWIHKPFHWSDQLKAGIIVSDPLRMVTPDKAVQLAANISHELRCEIMAEAVLPRRWRPWASMTVRPPRPGELRSAIQASSRSPRYKRVETRDGFIETPT